MDPENKPSADPRTRHASCVARNRQGVLLLGPSGAGKSDMALRLLDRGFRLVADDRVRLRGVMASPPDALRGLLEVRGVGILQVQAVFPVPVVLAVMLTGAVDRLPGSQRDPLLDVPMLCLCPQHPSAALRVEIALDCVLSARALQTGFLDQDPQGPHGGSVT